MRRSTLAWLALAVPASPALAQDALLYQGPVTPADLAPPASIVPDAIVVQFDEITAEDIADALGGRTEAAAPAGALQLGLDGFDLVAAQFGVHQVRKQFPGAGTLDALAQGQPDLSGFYVLDFDPALGTVDQVLKALLETPGVLDAQEIGIHPVWATPNDGNYSTQWHLNQASDDDIDAPEGWNIETGDASVIVAMLDTGVRYYHKDLGGSAASSSNPTAADGNMWINLAEKNGSAGVDDDGNGYVDDWVGYDFVTGASPCWSGEDCSTADNDPRDFNGHGTHCAGNVAAMNNNGYATCSPAGGWNSGTNTPAGNGVSVMAMRIGWSGSYLGQEVGYVRMDFAASALYYAAAKGARIASCSWGASNSGGIAAATDYFLAAGGLIFKAAGNDGTQTADYLCARSDVYCVVATDQSDRKASFSTYGTWADISAPGVAILSSYHSHADPANDYIATLDGTSMATPLTASVAAAVWSHNPSWTAAQVWTQVRDSADNIDASNPSYLGKIGSGRINLLNAVNTSAGCQNNSQCDDGDPCNGAETCVAGVCQPGAITDCNGNGASDACDIAGGFSADCNGNGVPDECEGNPCGGTGHLLVAFSGSPSVPGVGVVADEDIVSYDLSTGTYSMYFDGSDVGLSSFTLDGLAVLPDGSLLVSTTAAGTVGGVSMDDSDILRFVPTSLGATTAGTWSLYFDGSDVGLTTNSEDIDAIGILSNGDLLISTSGNPSVTGLSGLADEDLIRFTPTSLGSTTSGTWSYYFDGSDVGLSTSSNENLDACSLTSTGGVLLSTVGDFSVTGLSGADEDVFLFTPTSLGSTTSGSFSSYYDGSAAGIASGADVIAAELIN